MGSFKVLKVASSRHIKHGMDSQKAKLQGHQCSSGLSLSLHATKILHSQYFKQAVSVNLSASSLSIEKKPSGAVVLTSAEPNFRK